MPSCGRLSCGLDRRKSPAARARPTRDGAISAARYSVSIRPRVSRYGASATAASVPFLSGFVTLASSGPFMRARACRIDVSPSVGLSSRSVNNSRNRAFVDPSYESMPAEPWRNPVAWASVSKSCADEIVRTGIDANKFAGASSERPTLLVSE